MPKKNKDNRIQQTYQQQEQYTQQMNQQPQSQQSKTTNKKSNSKQLQEDYRQAGYTNEYGQFVYYNGYYDEAGNWNDYMGYFDQNNTWIPWGGYYNSQGQFIQGAPPTQAAEGRKKSKERKQGGNLGIILFMLLIIVGICAGGYHIFTENQKVLKQIQEENSKLKQQVTAEVLELDLDGKRIISYTDDNQPVIGTDEKGNPILARVEKDEKGHPYVITRVMNTDGSIKSETRVLKLSANVISSEAGMQEALAKEKSAEEEKKKEEEDNKNKEFREQFDKDNSISKLPVEFYKEKTKDNIRMQEQSHRYMPVKIESDVDNLFQVYNYKMTLAPFKADGYINRDLFGRVLSSKYFRTLHIKVEVNPKAETGGLKITMTPNTQEAGDVINSKIDELIKLNTYSAIYENNKSLIQSQVMTVLSEIENQSQPTNYIVDNGFISSDKPYINEAHDKLLNILKASLDSQVTEEQIAVLLQLLTEGILQEKYKALQNTACDELNNYKQGLCGNAELVPTMEISSDYMQDIYVSSYKEALPILFRILYATYYDLGIKP